MSNEEILDFAVKIRKRMELKSSNLTHTLGRINDLNNEEINVIQALEDYVIEITDIADSVINIEDLNEHVNKEIFINLRTGNIYNYFDKFEDFIEGNKIECNLTDFYIADLDYWKSEPGSYSFQVKDYEENLKLIKFLKQLSDNETVFGNRLKLFFYKNRKGLDLEIEYNSNSLVSIEIDENFTNDIIESSIDEKKQIFVNELVNFLEKENSYVKLAEKWSTLFDSYNKSYSLFLSGFSFEKIKTSANEYFQKLTDRIYESISKASNYIFGIPVGYILLINNLDFTGKLIWKNFGIIILGTIFFILVKKILFKNIQEAIQAIERDIMDFMSKINNHSELKSIYDQLEELKSINLKKQNDKIKLAKSLSLTIYLVLIFMYIYIFIDISLFLI